MGNKRGQVTYKKLLKRGADLVSRYQLWQAEDHLLLVKECFTTEEYKRFYYSDIQALVIVLTPAYMMGLSVLGILSVALLSAAVFSEEKMVFGTMAGVFLFLLLVHLGSGRTCKCWIQTAVNNERLLMCKRVRHVRTLARRVKPQILAMQGEFSPENEEVAE